MKLNLDEIRVLPNISVKLEEKDLDEISAKVISDYDEDKISRSKWEQDAKAALEVAELQSKSKNFPFEDASNVKFPLLTTANIQFAARTYPEIVRNGKVVEIHVVGKDLDGIKAERAHRVSSHMSYQLLVETNEWEENTDRLLHLLPTVGTVFKKTYFDPVLSRNRSILCLHDEIVVNDNIKSIEDAPRISHILYKTKNQMLEYIRAGLFLEVDGLEENEVRKEYELIEQHRTLDLDGDGYAEPYVVTVDLETRKVLRIVARYDGDNIVYNNKREIVYIKPVVYFTDFHFIPHPSGRYHSIGFGHLLTPLNSAVNTILNQLIDAGTLANTQSGFITKSVRMKDQDLRLRRGEWKKVNVDGGGTLQQNLFPLIYKEPSVVLFQLLGLLISTTEKLASVTDALTGTQPGQNVPATTMLALVEQGLKVFTSIQRRLYRSFKKEYEKLYRLNRIYLDEEVYFRTMDEVGAVLQADYEDNSLDVVPVSDPNLSADAIRFAHDRIILDLLPTGVINVTEAVKRHLNNVGVPRVDSLMQEPPQGPSDKELELQVKLARDQEEVRLKESDLKLREIELRMKAAKTEAEVTKILAQAVESVANAEAAEAGSQLDQYKLQLDSLKLSLTALKTDLKSLNTSEDTNEIPNENRVAGVEGPSSDGSDIGLS